MNAICYLTYPSLAARSSAATPLVSSPRRGGTLPASAISATTTVLCTACRKSICQSSNVSPLRELFRLAYNPRVRTNLGWIMATIEDSIAALEDRIAKRLKVIAEENDAVVVDKRALEVLRALLPNAGATADALDSTGEVIDVYSLEPDAAVLHRENSFMGRSKQALNKLGGQEFHIGHVDKLFERLGIEIQAKNRRSRIASVLGRLTDEGFLVRTRDGSGNTPHHFRVRREGEPMTPRTPRAASKDDDNDGQNVIQLAA